MLRFLWYLLLTSVVSQALAAPEVHELQLKNGFKVLVVENHQSPVVYTSIWYRVGSSDEPNGLTGISHMLEHMMFKGTKEFPDGVFKQRIAELGGQQNAMTSDDFTAYYQLLPADALSTAMRLEADRMQYLAPTESGFEKEHAVVMEERHMRVDDNPQGLTWLHFNAAAFLNSPYHQPTIGWLPDIKQYTLHDVMDWYHRWYAPNNAEMIVIGDVKPSEVFKQAQQYFASISQKTLPVAKHKTEVSSYGLRQVSVKRPAQLPWIVMGYNVPTLAQLSKNDQWQAYALYLAAALLSEDNSGRLSQHLVRKRSLVTDASAWYSLTNRHHSLWVVEATPAKGKTMTAVQKGLLDEIHLLQSELVSSSELARIKQQVIAANTFSKNSLDDEAMMLGEAEMSGVSWQEVEAFNQRIQSVTSAQIQQVAQRYFQTSQLTIATLQPDHSSKAPKSSFNAGGLS